MLSPSIPKDSLAGAVVSFGRLLKENGFAVSIPSAMDALKGVSCVGVENLHDFQTVLRATFTVRREEWAMFDRLFTAFWMAGKILEEPQEDRGGKPGPGSMELDSSLAFDGIVLSEEDMSDSEEQNSWNAKPRPHEMYSPQDILREQDFKEIPQGEDFRMARLIREILAPLMRHVGVRRRPVWSAAPLDFRRLLRKNIRYGGEVYELPRFKPKKRIKKLVFLCDVSGSMNPYLRFILRFIKEIQAVPTKVETFVFATHLHRITPLLRRLPFSKALKELSYTIRDWSGGTRIGQCLQQFSSFRGGGVLGSSTVVMIHSDGWDRGDILLLEKEMAKIHRRSYRVIWINPLLGGPSYEPTCRGMKAALPHVDSFLPGHNLISLERLAGTLRGLL
ncbi:MAG: VWA domain-containing protein [Desulfomonilaceae bacterium]